MLPILLQVPTTTCPASAQGCVGQAASNGTTPLQELGLVILGALLGAILALIGEAIIIRKRENAKFEEMVELLRDEISTIAEQADDRFTPSKGSLSLPGPASTAVFDTLVASGDLKRFSREDAAALYKLYAAVKDANFLAGQVMPLQQISAAASQEIVKEEYSQEAERIGTEPWKRVRELSRQSLSRPRFKGEPS
jgi:hypothetical protein